MGLSTKFPSLKSLTARLATMSRNIPRELKNTAVSVGRAGATETKHAANAIYNASMARIADGITVDTSGNNVTIRGKKKMLTLRSFGSKQTARGVAVTIIRARGRKIIRGGFSPKKFNNVPFKRLGRSQYPIAPIQGPSVADMMDNPAVGGPLAETLQLRAEKEVIQRIVRLIKNG